MNTAAALPSRRDQGGTMRLWHSKTRRPGLSASRVRPVVGALVVAGVLGGVGVGVSVGAATTTTTTAPASATPLAPTAVTATQNGVAPDLKVSWTPAVTGPAATGAIVQLYQVANLQDQDAQYLIELTCEASC